MFGAIRCTFSKCTDKQEYKNTFDKLTSISTEILTEATNQTNAKVLNSADLTIENSSFLGCEFNASQSINADIKVISQLESQSRTQLLDKLADTITNKIEQETSDKTDAFKSAVTGWLGATPNKSKKSEVKTNITQIISNKLTDKVLNDIIVDATNKLTTTIKGTTISVCDASFIEAVCGDGKCTPAEAAELYNSICKVQQADGSYKFPPCSATQDIYVKVIAENITKKTFEAFKESITGTTLQTELMQTTQEEGGLFSSIPTAGWIVMGIIGLIILTVIFMRMYSAFVGRQQGTPVQQAQAPQNGG
jgi:uncharacterized membrane protein